MISSLLVTVSTKNILLKLGIVYVWHVAILTQEEFFRRSEKAIELGKITRPEKDTAYLDLLDRLQGVGLDFRED